MFFTKNFKIFSFVLIDSKKPEKRHEPKAHALIYYFNLSLNAVFGVSVEDLRFPLILTSLTTIPDNANNAITFGITIKLLNISEKDQTKLLLRKEPSNMNANAIIV